MKLLIDTDKMASVLNAVSREKRQEYLYLKLREAHQGKSLENWMARIDSEPPTKGASLTGLFETFWKAYPPRNGVRSGKAQAEKCWKKAAKKKAEPELLKACLKALEWQKKDEMWTKDNGMYIPMASTYINQKRWEDEGQNSDDWEEYYDMNGALRKRRKA